MSHLIPRCLSFLASQLPMSAWTPVDGSFTAPASQSFSSTPSAPSALVPTFRTCNAFSRNLLASNAIDLSPSLLRFPSPAPLYSPTDATVKLDGQSQTAQHDIMTGLPALTQSGATTAPTVTSQTGEEWYHGDLTYYDPSGAPTACNTRQTPEDHIVAVSPQIFDPYTPAGNANGNALCGRRILIRMDAQVGELREAEVTIVDRCEACVGGDLDITQPLHERLSYDSQAKGRLTGMSWKWI